MIDIQERLNEALRQYRHNNSDEFVFAYDLQLIAKLVDDLVQDNDDLRVQCGGMQLTIDEMKTPHCIVINPTLEKFEELKALLIEQGIAAADSGDISPLENVRARWVQKGLREELEITSIDQLGADADCALCYDVGRIAVDDPCDAPIATTECPLCKGEGKPNVS